MQNKCFSFDAECKREQGVFSGYASVFDVIDCQGDVIKFGAFSSAKANAIILWQHKQDQPIGKITKLVQNADGLYIHGKLITEVKKGYEAYKLLQSGIIDGLSIGYIPKSYNIDRKSGARIIKKLDLIEVSLVTFPANKDAKVGSVKSSSDAYDLNDLKKHKMKNAVRKLIQVLR